MKGCLYSVGVGPGDPELMTVKAMQTIQKCPVIILPAASRENCVAYQIARQMVPEIEEKESLCLVMPMVKDKKILDENHEAAAEKVAAILETGQNAAFITIGDPTVYATSMYIHQRVAQMGYQTEIISGVPSFCAAAAKLGISLGERQEQIHIIPASYDIENAMTLPGTKILMKAGKKISVVKQCVQQHHEWIAMVENCGMENERLWTDAEKMPENPGYYTLMIAKDRKEA